MEQHELDESQPDSTSPSTSPTSLASATPATPEPSATPAVPTPNTVTLATVAARVGVSRSTISNAYNHPDQLSAELRERVLTAAAELGYTGPDPVARRLRKGRTGAIGVLFSEPLQQIFADIAALFFLQGVAEASAEVDSGLYLVPTNPTEQGAAVVRDAMVDGFILYSTPPDHPFAQAAMRRHIPLVCVDQTQVPGVTWVGIDDEEAAFAAAQHVVALGHTRIAVCVYGLRDTSGRATLHDAALVQTNVSTLRLSGYRRACETAGVRWSDVRVDECAHNTSEEGKRVAKELLGALMTGESGESGESGETSSSASGPSTANTSRPTAILCTSDALAIGVLEAADELGIVVPDQLSVVGFNDIPAASATTPALTTVRQPLREKGKKAAEQLLNSVPAIHNEHLDATLIIRDSTGPAPQ